MKKSKYKLIDRREFLKLTGLVAGGAAASQVLFSELMAVPESMLSRVARGRGQESWINTVCGQCPGGCGLQVRRIDGVPVYLKGNPLFPVNRGGTCPLAHTSMEVLFNPDRLKNPMIHSSRGSGSTGSEISWDEALSSLSTRLKNLVDSGHGDRIALINGDTSPLMRRLSRHWLAAMGSRHYFEPDLNRPGNIPMQLSQGIKDIPAFDLLNCRTILNFGNNFLEEGTSPIHFNQLYGELRSVDQGVRTRILHIDSRLNLTASNADRWIPVHPGTYGALALGIAYVLIVDNLVDQDFITRIAHGFKPFLDSQGLRHMGFESFVRANYNLKKVSQITGVPVETILEIGEEFGTHRPAVAISDHSARFTTNGGFNQWAVYCLNALVGNFQREGGVFFPAPPPEMTFPQIPETPSNPEEKNSPENPPLFGDPSLDRFVRSLLDQEPGTVDTLIIVNANPVYHSRHRDQLIKALNSISNIVYVGLFLDETARVSDLILPDHSPMEKSDISGPIPGLMFTHIGYQQPIVKPLFNTRQSGDILIELGRRIRGNKVIPWKNYRGLVQKRLEAVYDSGEGAILSKASGAEWLTYLKERGWKLEQYETFRDFYRLIKKQGGWWNPKPPLRSRRDLFRTPSGKFEFASAILDQRLNELTGKIEKDSRTEERERLLNNLHITARGNGLILPHHEDVFTEEKTDSYPLILTVSQLLTNRNGWGASQPSMLEIIGIQKGMYWKSWMEIHPETGKEYGLQNHHRAWIESSKGELNVEVFFFPGIKPGVVHVNLGLGHTHFGRFGTGIGVNVLDIVENRYDALTDTPALNGTRIKVRPAGDKS